MRPLICRLLHPLAAPMFDRVDGRQVHRCPLCGRTWPVLPPVVGVPEDFRPERVVREARQCEQFFAERERRAAAMRRRGLRVVGGSSGRGVAR